MNKTTWEQVLALLRTKADTVFTGCIRVKHEVDKEALRQLSAEQLAEVGCRLEQTDTFYYELDEVELHGTQTQEMHNE